MHTDATPDFLNLLGLDEEPFGIFYTDTKPENGFGPKEGPEVSRALEARGKMDFGGIGTNFSCFIGNIWLARKKKREAYISRKQYGCMGGMFYTGVNLPYLETIVYYVSTGIPNTPMHGERYMPSPQSMRTFLDDLRPRPAPAEYCVAKPLSSFAEGETPELVTFFARPEALSGLFTLAIYASGDPQVNQSPFGPGCGQIVTWPLRYLAEGREVAVLGIFDPSARKFLKTDEMTYTVPLSLYKKMLEAAPSSFLKTDTWETVQRKVERSRKAWGE